MNIKEGIRLDEELVLKTSTTFKTRSVGSSPTSSSKHTLGWGAKWSPKPKDKVRLLECVQKLYLYGYNYMQKHTYYYHTGIIYVNAYNIRYCGRAAKADGCNPEDREFESRRYLNQKKNLPGQATPAKGMDPKGLGIKASFFCKCICGIKVNWQNTQAQNLEL